MHFYLVNVAQPFTDVFEALGIGDVVDQHDTHGSSVIGGGDGVESFLARCVPAETNTCRCSSELRLPHFLNNWMGGDFLYFVF